MAFWLDHRKQRIVHEGQKWEVGPEKHKRKGNQNYFTVKICALYNPDDLSHYPAPSNSNRGPIQSLDINFNKMTPKITVDNIHDTTLVEHQFNDPLWNYRQSTSRKTLGWMNHKLESRLPEKCQQPQIYRWHASNSRKQRGAQEFLDEGEREEWKTIQNIQKTQHSKN